ncbi:hypothetical protein ACFC1B_21805 [Streptomyces xiamenensis]|uniref:hypothetical protein n=1 Tax=Streptomyces xiamenensis TaxID=408015 RepID=UPI0035D6BB76
MAGADSAVLEVAGGHLTWTVWDIAADPVAVLDDLPAAQGWLWALYGEAAALRAASGEPLGPAVPALPGLARAARRLAYAHWAARWWPASVIDGIPPLDDRLLTAEIAELEQECELLSGGEEYGEYGEYGEHGASEEYEDGGAATSPAGTPPRTDYALAAGPGASGSTRVLARGTAGTDWRRVPPGLLDASEQALSWEIVRSATRRTEVELSVVAGAGLTDRVPVPAQLLPRATVTAADGSTAQAPLRLTDDSWTGTAELPGAGPLTFTVHLPAFPDPPTPDDAAQRALRERVRALARARLAGVPSDIAPLRAERAAEQEF